MSAHLLRIQIEPSGYLLSKLQEKDIVMGGKADEVKGRIKEAAGDLTDDQDLKDSGKADKAAR